MKIMHTHGKAHKCLEKYDMELKTSCSALLLHKLIFWFAKSFPQQIALLFWYSDPRSVCVCQSLSRVQLFVTSWTIALQAHLSMGFSRQEHWSGLPFPSPRDLPNQGIEPRSPALQADSFLSEPPVKPIQIHGERLLKQ